MDQQTLTEQIDTTLYPDRWIAVVRQRVVGVGLTAQQAYRTAKQTRPKDKPHLLFVDNEGNVKQPVNLALNKTWLNQHPLLQQIAHITQANHFETYLVGGAVRDLLLGRESIVDLDFAVAGDGLAIARRVANVLNAAFYPLDSERGTGRVVYEVSGKFGPKKNYLDFAAFRGASLAEDLADRDFTINAMALNLADPAHLIDPLNGKHDLELGQIRAVSEKTFLNDPVRVLRAVRQAANFQFVIETNTRQRIGQAAPQLHQVSPERQRDELLKLLNTSTPDRAVQELHDLNILPHLLPNVEAMVGVTQSPPHHLDVFGHTVAALTAWTQIQQSHFADLPAKFQAAIKQYFNQSLAGDVTLQVLMPLAILLHDTGKPLTRNEDIQEDNDYTKIRFLGHEKESSNIARRIASSFHFSTQAIGFIETVTAHHMRPLWLAQQGKVSRRAIYRLFRDTAGGGYQAGVAVALHALADHRATYPPGQGQTEEEALLNVIDQLLTAYFEQREQVVEPPPLLTGRDLINDLNLTEGQLIGLLLNRLKEAQAAGEIQTQTEAWHFIKADPDFLKNKGEH